MSAVRKLDESLDNCRGCGQFVAKGDGYLDHSKQGCDQRDDGIDSCGCDPVYFCHDGCAYRFHEEASK